MSNQTFQRVSMQISMTFAPSPPVKNTYSSVRAAGFPS